MNRNETISHTRDCCGLSFNKTMVLSYLLGATDNGHYQGLSGSARIWIDKCKLDGHLSNTGPLDADAVETLRQDLIDRKVSDKVAADAARLGVILSTDNEQQLDSWMEENANTRGTTKGSGGATGEKTDAVETTTK